MNPNQTKPETQTAKDRRAFLKLSAATLLAGAALPEAAQAFIDPTADLKRPIYNGGVVSSPDVPGVIFNVYVAVDEDGTGVGTVSDTLHPQANAHLAVQTTEREGNATRFAGVVSAANDAALVGQPFVVAGVVTENFTSLALRLGLDGATFTGQGFSVRAPKYIDPGSNL